MIGSSYCYRQLHPWGSTSAAGLALVLGGGYDRARRDGSGSGFEAPAALPAPATSAIPPGLLAGAAQPTAGAVRSASAPLLTLEGLGYLGRGQFAAPLTPAAVRQVRLDAGALYFWRELLGLDLTSSLRRAVEHAIRNHKWGSPPHGTLRGEARRIWLASRQAAELLRALA